MPLKPMTNLKKVLIPFVFLFLVIAVPLRCQDVAQARQLVEKLSSKEFWGRGYTNNGMARAAGFIESEFKAYGLHPLFGKSFSQDFTYPINTFPGKMQVSLNGKKLEPGRDFIISAESRGVGADVNLVQVDSIHFLNKEKRIEVVLQEKLTWSASTEAKDFTSVLINGKNVSEVPARISIQVENKFNSKFRASNLGGFIRGTKKPDSLIIITAHYDHLGGLGSETYFPGANDNASGIALLLSLARHYSKNIPEYSMAFICFAGEEAGLIGSNYFVEHTPVSLSKIRFLINLDLTGTGDEGITVVNGSVFKNEFSVLTTINDQKNYLVKIKSRGKAANSDHYWFTEKGVPSYFIYTMGGIQAYHDVYDKSETLPLTEFEDLFHLIVDFNQQLMN